MLIGPALAVAVSLVCPSLSGSQQLWKKPETKFIMVGELHGTSEVPVIFGDLICNAAKSGRPLIVAVEQPDSEQPAIDLFLSSDGGSGAQATFKQSAIWTNPFKDGRSSLANFELFERLRLMERAGYVVRVVAFKPTEVSKRTDTSTGYNAVMAERLKLALARDPRTLVLALVGNIHARKIPTRFGSEEIISAAADLPADQTISLNVPVSGEIWNCRTPFAKDCGPHPEPGIVDSDRGVVLNPQIAGGYDGEIRLGIPVSASPPAVQLP